MRSFLKIDYPCSAHWSEMKGDDKVRMCELCNKQVHNVCKSSKAEMKALIAEAKANGEHRFCIYIEPPLVKRVFYCFAALLVSLVLFKKPLIRKLLGEPLGDGSAGGATLRLSKEDFADYRKKK